MRFKCKIRFNCQIHFISSYSVYSNNTVQHKYTVSSIQSIDGTLSGATIPGQSGPGSDGNEGVLSILQNFSTAGTSPSDCLVSYIRTLARGVLEVQSEYSTAPADWAIQS